MQKHNFYLAPLRGITDCIFRNVYERHFGQFDYMLAPFVPTVRGNRVRDYHIADLLPVNYNNGRGNDPARLIPQIIGYNSAGFLLLCHKFADLGFASVNWNLGCPAPLVTKKKRGAGLLPHRDMIEKFLNEVMPKLPIPMSIKARLGLDKNDELCNLISAFNNCQLKELIIHPRTGLQAYDGTVELDKFEECMKKSTHTIVYNGDICTVDDFIRLTKRFPSVNNWMAGRGIIKNPYLLNELKSAVDNSKISISKKENTQAIKNFLYDLLDANITPPHPPANVLGKMKEIWGFLGQNLELDETGELSQKIMRCESIGEYREIVILIQNRSECVPVL